jgi:AcrR family transcriptional regulator
MKRAVRRSESGRPRDEARAVFRNAILEAAEAVFAERGLHGARIQDISARARIAVGTVYNHFRRKEEVLDALLEERTREMLAELAPRAGEPADFEACLTARLRRMLAFIEQHRGFYSIVTSLPGTPAKIQRMRAAFRVLVDDGLDAGVLSKRIDAAQLANFLGGTIRAAIFPALERGAPVKDRAETIVDLFLHGAGSGPLRAAQGGSPGPLRKAQGGSPGPLRKAQGGSQ